MHTVKFTEKNGSVTSTSFPRLAMATKYAMAIGGTVAQGGTDDAESFEVLNCDAVMVERRRIALATIRPDIASAVEEVFASEEEEEAPLTEVDNHEEEEEAPDTIRDQDFSNAAE